MLLVLKYLVFRGAGRRRKKAHVTTLYVTTLYVTTLYISMATLFLGKNVRKSLTDATVGQQRERQGIIDEVKGLTGTVQQDYLWAGWTRWQLDH